MRFLIYCRINTFSDYTSFAKALVKLGIRVGCFHRSRITSQSALLREVPDPILMKLIKRFDPSIVMSDTPLYALKMAKLTGRKVIYHMLGNLWTEFNPYEALSRSIFGRIYKHYEISVLDKSIQDADLVLANSKWLLNIISRKIPSRPAKLFYTGIDAKEWFPCQTDIFRLKHPAVVGLFEFSVYPKTLGLLRFTEVIRKMPDVNFYFAGKGLYFDFVKKSCPSNMFLLGRVTKSEARALLSSADVFVHPSGLDVLPRSVKEASLMEKPIIASNVGGIPEIVRNNQTGYLCEIDDVDQWVEKIRFLLDNPDVAKMFGKNARKFVMETFDWGRIAENFVQDLKFL